MAGHRTRSVVAAADQPSPPRLSRVIVNLHEAKTHLSRLVAQAAAGEEIIIGKAGKPVARLIAYREDTTPRRSGALKGHLWIADDFDETPEWLVDAFGGSP